MINADFVVRELIKKVIEVIKIEEFDGPMDDVSEYRKSRISEGEDLLINMNYDKALMYLSIWLTGEEA